MSGTKNISTYFHGTTESFFKGNIKNGTYKPGINIYLTPFMTSAVGYSVSRAKFYNNKPLLIFIDPLQTYMRIKKDEVRNPYIEYLDLNEIVYLSFSLKDKLDEVSQKIIKLFDKKFGYVPLDYKFLLYSQSPSLIQLR